MSSRLCRVYGIKNDIRNEALGEIMFLDSSKSAEWELFLTMLKVHPRVNINSTSGEADRAKQNHYRLLMREAIAAADVAKESGLIL